MYITNVLVILFGSIACAVVSLDSNSRPVNPKTPALVNRRNGLIGAGIVSAIGFKYYMDGPVFKEMVDLKGYNVVITGANTGLGKEAAIKLAELGANVYILVRSLEKGQIVCDELRKTSAVGQQIEALSLDLSSLRSVEECAKAITSKLGSTGIDILMNNAGVMAIPQRETTKDGFEAHMGINHLGHFALTSLLFPLLKKGGKGKGARIINISSAAHMLGKLDFNNLMLEKEGTYQPWPAYGNSKLANILFTKELNRCV
jgi:NAD(P)-dependent dehydrogenase (short-subunit alcohol dehydrogenase family)